MTTRTHEPPAPLPLAPESFEDEPPRPLPTAHLAWCPACSTFVPVPDDHRCPNCGREGL